MIDMRSAVRDDTRRSSMLAPRALTNHDSHQFSGAITFNRDLHWDTSNVLTMEGMVSRVRQEPWMCTTLTLSVD